MPETPVCMRYLIWLLFIVFAHATTHFAQDRTKNPFDFPRSPEYFESIISRTPADFLFVLYQTNYPYSGTHFSASLNKNGESRSARMTPMAVQASRRGMLDEGELILVKQLLSNLILITNDKAPLVKKDDSYSVLIINDGKDPVRLNFVGEAPDNLKQILGILHDAFERTARKEQEQASEKNTLLREKYGNWLEKPGIIRPSDSGTARMNGNNRDLIYIYGLIQPVTDEHRVEVPVYYVLISHSSPGHYIGGIGGMRSSEDPIYKGGMRWATGDGYTAEKELVITYDAINSSLQIGTFNFELSAGNVFKIDMDQNWNPIVTQSPLRVKSKLESDKLIEVLRHAFNDETLEFYR